MANPLDIPWGHIDAQTAWRWYFEKAEVRKPVETVARYMGGEYQATWHEEGSPVGYRLSHDCG
jgi:hypothetical protein